VYGVNQDTLLLNTIRVNVVKSNDSLYHIYAVRFARGRNPETALRAAEKIQFEINQNDSLLILPKGFPISKDDKFRNQKVLFVVEVPVGKKIQLDRSLNHYDWFDVDFNYRRGWNAHWDENWERSYGWRDNVEYVMTESGLQRTDRKNDDEYVEPSGDEGAAQPNDTTSQQNQYRYRGNERERKTSPDTPKAEKATAENDPTTDTESEPYPSLIYMLSRIAR
jgi:hypothetical protein